MDHQNVPLTSVLMALEHPPTYVYQPGEEVSGRVWFPGAAVGTIIESMTATLEGRQKCLVREDRGEYAPMWHPHESIFLNRSQKVVSESSPVQPFIFSLTMPHNIDACNFEDSLPEHGWFEVGPTTPPPDFISAKSGILGAQHAAITYRIVVEGIRRIAGYPYGFKVERAFHYCPIRTEESPAPKPQKQSFQLRCRIQEGGFWRGERREAVVDILKYFPTVFCVGDSLNLPIELVVDKFNTTASWIPEILMTRLKVALNFVTPCRGAKKYPSLVSTSIAEEEIVDLKFDEPVVLPLNSLIDLSQFASIVIPESTTPTFKFWTITRDIRLKVTIHARFNSRISLYHTISNQYCNVLPKIYRPLDEGTDNKSDEAPPPAYVEKAIANS